MNRFANMSAMIECKECGQQAPRRGPRQLYCEPCSLKKSIVRAGDKRAAHRRKSAIRAHGEQISVNSSESLGWDASSPLDLLWEVRIRMPFAWAASKNHIYSLNSSGHVALRRGAKKYREDIGWRMKSALNGRRIANNKLWISIFVQKSNHKGDAVNVVDLVCDAIKDVIDLDDRWFCIRRLDWEVTKRDPHIFIGIGQNTMEDAQVCSYCGRILPLEKFRKRRHSKLGVGRECRDCLTKTEVLGDAECLVTIQEHTP